MYHRVLFPDVEHSCKTLELFCQPIVRDILLKLIVMGIIHRFGRIGRKCYLSGRPPHPSRLFIPYFLISSIFGIFAAWLLYYAQTIPPHRSTVKLHDPPPCSLCNFTTVGHPASGRRDAVFAAVTQYGPGVSRFIRSLRTTGCRAAIIIFATSNVIFPDSLLACQIRLVVVNQTARGKVSPYKIRWEWYYDHLLEIGDAYDRILHADAFDVFFYGDPFGYAPDRGSLYFPTEDRKIRSCPFNKAWLLECHHDVNRFQVTHNIIACSGSLIGGAKLFVQFVHMLITHPEWPSCWRRGYDQGDFNYILYVKYLPKNLSARLLGCNSGFLTMEHCSKKRLEFNEKGQLLTPNREKIVTFVHQYNRYKKTTKEFARMCH
jgi:hypothetical protein